MYIWAVWSIFLDRYFFDKYFMICILFYRNETFLTIWVFNTTRIFRLIIKKNRRHATLLSVSVYLTLTFLGCILNVWINIKYVYSNDIIPFICSFTVFLRDTDLETINKITHIQSVSRCRVHQLAQRKKER